MLRLKNLLNHALEIGKQKEWPTYDGKVLDRTEFLSSSEVGTCIRKAFFAKYLEKYPSKVTSINGFAHRGDAIESWLVGKLDPLKTLGYEFSYMGSDQRSFYDPDLGISGTPDGVMRTPERENILLEIKSIDPRYNKNNLPKKPHVAQTIQNIYLVEKCLDIKITHAILIYFDASNVLDINEYVIEFSQEAFDRSIERAKALWEADSPEELEPEGIYTGDCDYCPFTQHCSATVSITNQLLKAAESSENFSVALVEENDDQGTISGLDDREAEIVDLFLNAREGYKEYEKEVDELKGQVQQIVVQHGNVVLYNDTVLTTRTMPGKETIDKKSLEAAEIDWTQHTKIGNPYIVLNVKGPKTN